MPLWDTNLGDVLSDTIQGSLVVKGGVVVTGGVVVSGTVAVTGAVAMSGGLSVSGPVSFSSPAVIGSNVQFAPVAPSINLTTATNSFTAAVLLTAVRNVVISASFTSGSPVSLPSVATWIGAVIQVFNQSTMTVAVWPQPLDRIDVVATGTNVLLDAGKRADFFAVSATGIISAQMGVTSV